MKKSCKILIFLLTAVVLITATVPYAFAKDFAPKLDSANIGMQTQYAYSEKNVSWLRKLVIKEDMLSPEGIATESVLIPVTSYPYITDADHFKREVEESIKTYTLDEESQRAAYIYLLNQIGALTIISEPTVSNQTKADWLREKGIVVTAADEANAERMLMISALYAMMRNDLYYVYKGDHLEIPAGTPMEEALVMYIAALSGNDKSLTVFMLKFFGSDKMGSIEDYIYYTSLMALFSNGYVSASEVTVLERKEVFRRVAIMTIQNYGLAVDAENATQQELTEKYLTAMLGTQYKVSLDPASLVSAQKKQTIPYYILQRMAKEDSNITISYNRYSYDECFDLVLRKTGRFNLKKEFYSDIYEYDVHLKANRTSISINPTPLKSTTSVTINGSQVTPGKYAIVPLLNQTKQTITIVATHTVNNAKTVSTYKVNIYQGTEIPETSPITGIIATIGPSNGNSSPYNPDLNISGPQMAPIVSGLNGGVVDIVGDILHVNAQGQLVDKNNNVVSPGIFAPAEEGYQYVMTDDGIFQVYVGAATVSTTSPSGDSTANEEPNKLIIIIALVACVLLLAALVILIVVTKKRGKMTDAEKMKARKAKEKAKLAKKAK